MVLENFRRGLEVTALGMGLVFLTLVVIMLAIYLLDRIFRDKAGERATPLVDAGATEETVPASADEAAAIAVAIALQKEQKREEGDYDEEIVGEVVMVASIEPGTGAWRGHGRLRAMQ